MKKIKKIGVFILALLIAAAGFVPAAANSTDAERLSDGIIACNLQKTSSADIQSWIDSALTEDAGCGSEWYVIALANCKSYDFSAYKKALENYLLQNEVGSASSRLKFALTFIAIGDNANPYIAKTVDGAIGNQGIMSLVFGLHILNNGYKSNLHSADRVIGELLSLQLPDGGWALSGEYGDVDVTAMTIQALASHCKTNPEVKSAVEKSLVFLSDRQLESGGYSSYGISNSESVSQVIIALSSLGIDGLSDSRFIRNGNTLFDGINQFRLDDGSFCHKANGNSDSTATAQAFCAATAYLKMKNGKTPFYVFAESKKTETTAATTSEAPSTLPPTTSAVSETSAVSSQTETQAAENIQKAENEIRLPILLIPAVTAIICLAFAIKKRSFVPLVVLALAVTLLLTGYPQIFRSNSSLGTVSISISCDAVKNEGKSHIPANGIILDKTEIEIRNGDTVYDVFSEVCKKNGILFSPRGAGELVYIEGIANIYEYDFGDESGWLYFVNGECPSVGCGSYALSDGDCIEWIYTLSLSPELDIG